MELFDRADGEVDMCAVVTSSVEVKVQGLIHTSTFLSSSDRLVLTLDMAVWSVAVLLTYSLTRCTFAVLHFSFESCSSVGTG